MDYLKQQNLASVPALFVICRYLATRPDGEDEAALRRVLQPRAMIANQGPAPRDDERRDVLPASLEVGRDIELLDAQGSRRERVWSLRESVRAEVAAVPAADSRPFRNLVLRSLGARAMQVIESGERPADVALALTWLLQGDPLSPLSTSWSDGPEMAVRRSGLDLAVSSPEQWRALVRWARSLGLATATAARQKSYLVVDPTKAVDDTLGRLPRQGPAETWFRQLHSLLPVLGHRALISALPGPRGSATEIPAATALAVCKLERAGRLRLLQSDDASSTVVLRLGHQVRQVGEVHVVEAVA
ncbi:hypothetical protein HC031_14145 [Planosporangium thailandense]|uniref:Uncharacterized protein n=1 Tax=Planosporangium thailandense TaxID=765197 RepID=A0ABX0Y0F5_9ACTN|nr:hypothetical protein [Planosporangium thailandense]NJC70849.1 hypothetical protein [Planosporangium thailandense]